MPINQEAVMTVSYHNRCTILIVTIAAMGSITYGYCSVIISSTLASELSQTVLGKSSGRR